MIHKTTASLTASSGNEHWFEEHSLFVRYLISRHTHHRMEVWVSPVNDEQAMPVFSTPRAAGEYLRSKNLGIDWHVRESTAGELVSLLMGHVADVGTVVLDPPPGVSASKDSSLNCLSKEAFIGSLMKEPMLMSPN